MSDKRAADLVISYSMGYSGVLAKEDYQRVLAALEDGYRVVDTFSTPVGGGGASSSVGCVVVTVILADPTQLADGLLYRDFER